MRTFTSYGPIKTHLHYYAPRTELIDSIYHQLLGADPYDDGHYITVWAPRQTGKTWMMNEVLFRLRREQPEFYTAKLNLQDLERENAPGVFRALATRLGREIHRDLPPPGSQLEFAELFSHTVLDKPLILMLDEFDALTEEAISGVVNVLRNLYMHRRQEANRLTDEKTYLLHGVALIGVRSVLGIGNHSGSPFNVQRSVHIPNLSPTEVTGMFTWYTEESGQQIAADVLDRIYDEMQGQPGLTGWFGELLTETYHHNRPTITMQDFTTVLEAALNTPNNTILNILSKAQHEAARPLVLRLFETAAKIPFRYDDPQTNFLYMHGVIDQESAASATRYLKFPSPFVQKRLFNYFAYELYGALGRLYDPFDDLSDTITPTSLDMAVFIRRYETYVQQNRQRLFQHAPRRLTDGRIYEAVYHFNFYMYITQFLASYEGSVIPEFPTGNGQVDLFIHYAGTTYGIEVKSFVNRTAYDHALTQTAHYGQQLGLTHMWLVFFVEAVSDEHRRTFETTYLDATTNVTVQPLLVVTG